MAGKTIKGLTVEIGGDTTKLGKALSDVNKHSKSLSDELKAVNKLLKLDPSNTELVAQKQRILAESIDNAKEKLKILREAEDQVTAAFERGDASEEQVRELKREIIKTEQELNSYKDAAEDCGNKTKDFGEKAEKSSQNVKKAGEFIKDTAKAIAAAAVAIIGATVAVGKKVWEMATDVAAAGDEIDKNAQKIGLSTKAYQEWAYVFDHAGANVDNLQSGMKTLSEVIVEAANGSESAKKKLDAVGLSIEQLNGLSQEEQLGLVIEALQNMEAGAERTAAANDLLGKSSSDMAAVLNMTSEEVDALKAEANDYGMIMSDEAVASSAAFSDSLTRLRGTAEGLKRSLIGELLPGITGIMDGIAALVAGSDDASVKITSGASEFIASLGGLVPQSIEIVQSLAAAVLGASPQILGALIDGIISVLPEIGRIAAPVALQLIDLVRSALPGVVNAALEIVSVVAGTIADAVPELIPALISTVTSLVEDLLSTGVPMLIEAALGLINGLAEGLLNGIDVLVGVLSDIIGALGKALNAAWPSLLNTVKVVLTKVWNKLPEVLRVLMAEVLPSAVMMLGDLLMTLLPEFVSLGIDLIKTLGAMMPVILRTFFSLLYEDLYPMLGELAVELIPGVLDMAYQLVFALLDALPEILVGLYGAIPDIVMNMITALTKMIPLFVELAGKTIMTVANAYPRFWINLVKAVISLVKGLIQNLIDLWPRFIETAKTWIENIKNGFTDAWQNLVAKAKELAGELPDKITSVLAKIKEVGKNLVKGLWQGISDAKAWLMEKIEGFSSSVLDGIKGFFGIHSPSTVLENEVGKNMILGLVRGIKRNAYSAINAMRELGTDVMSVFDLDVSSSGALGRALYSPSPAIFSTTGADISSVAGKLDAILGAIKEGKIIALDGDKLVGGTIGRINTELGAGLILAGRSAI